MRGQDTIFSVYSHFCMVLLYILNVVVIINNYHSEDSNKLVYTVILQVIHTVVDNFQGVINNKKRLKTVICGELSSVIHTFSTYLCNICNNSVILKCKP